MTHLKPSFPSCPDVLSCADVLAVFQAELARAVPTPGLPPAGPQLWPRFTGYYERLARLPRRARRALQRKWRRPLGAIALLLALGQAPALAATINVDGTSCTLVDAITAANNDGFAGGCAAGSGADTIVLPSNSIHTLTAVDNTTYVFGPTGLPIITSAITIQGNGSTIKREGSAPPFRILVVRFNGNLFLQETTVSGGVGVARGGGGLLNEGNLTLRNCVVSGNSGGGLLNVGNLTLTNCVVSGNSGGGLANFRYGTLTLSNSTVSGNSAGRGGGLNNTATLFVEASVVSGNSAGEGGGLDNDGTLTLTDSTVSGNSAFDGGGVFNDESGTLTLTRSAVSGNSATHPSGCCLYNGGGGINNDGLLFLTDSTVSTNVTNVSGGGVLNDGALNVTHSTVSGNVAKSGGGLYNVRGAGLTLVQTLISGNIASQGASEVHRNNVGRVAANNFNVFGHSGSAGVQGLAPGVTDIVPTQPLTAILDPVLRNNGGRTTTHALVQGSPAVDAIPTANCATTVDQRGVPRPQDGSENGVADCDIGAVEGVPPLPLPPLPPQPPPPPPPVEEQPVAAVPATPQALIPCTGPACRILITCNLARDSGTQCANRFTLFVSKRGARLSEAALARAPKRIRFASAVTNIPPGQTLKVRLKLTKKGKDIVKENKGKRLRAVLAIQNLARTSVTNTPVRIRLK